MNYLLLKGKLSVEFHGKSRLVSPHGPLLPTFSSASRSFNIQPRRRGIKAVEILPDLARQLGPANTERAAIGAGAEHRAGWREPRITPFARPGPASTRAQLRDRAVWPAGQAPGPSRPTPRSNHVGPGDDRSRGSRDCGPNRAIYPKGASHNTHYVEPETHLASNGARPIRPHWRRRLNIMRVMVNGAVNTCEAQPPAGPSDPMRAPGRRAGAGAPSRGPKDRRARP